MFSGYEKDEGKEAFQEDALKVKEVQEAVEEALEEALQEAFQETLQEALKEAFRETLQEALRLQELRSLVPLYGGDEGFCHEGDGDRALCSQVGFFLSVPYHIKMIKASLVVPKQTTF